MLWHDASNDRKYWNSIGETRISQYMCTIVSYRILSQILLLLCRYMPSYLNLVILYRFFRCWQYNTYSNYVFFIIAIIFIITVIIEFN